jgi:redox-sensitive bicupin YhaK (pirin superfamily)
VLTIRPAGERGHTTLDWLDSYHTFSFGGYQDERFSGFRALRVLNDDRLAPATGFGAHGHRDMEILTYVLSGAVAHRDSTGTGERLGANEAQLMTAGSGVIHSEFNASAADPAHFLQIWIVPAVADLPPAYQQITFLPSETRGRLRLIAGPADGIGNGSALAIHQDARIYAAALDGAERVTYELTPGRGAWLHCATGRIIVNDLPMTAGDGVAIVSETALVIAGADSAVSELLLFDLA